MTVVSTPDNYEANDDMVNAKDIQLGKTILGTIDSSLDVDLYKVSISDSQTYKVAMQHIPSGCDYDIYLYDSNGNLVMGSCSGGNADENLITSLTSGDYYIKVCPYTGSSEVGEYQLSVSGGSSLEVSMPYVKTSAGSLIEVPVSISNLPSTGICSFNFYVNYDKNALTYTGFTAGALTSGTNADLEVNEVSDGLNVFFIDDSAGFNTPLTLSGEVVKLKFQVKAGIADGAYVLGYSNGWGFTSMDGNATPVEIGALFKPGLVTTGVYNIYSEVPFTQPKFLVLTVYAGDLNIDGKINSTDMSYLKRYILNTITSLPDIKRADVSGDGKINSTDYSILKRYVQGLIDSFPCGGTVSRSIF